MRRPVVDLRLTERLRKIRDPLDFASIVLQKELGVGCLDWVVETLELDSKFAKNVPVGIVAKLVAKSALSSKLLSLGKTSNEQELVLNG